MKFLVLTSHDPYLNLAIEEYLFESCDDDVFMLWQNEPSVVVGKNQNLYAEVDVARLIDLGIHPVRRITGGGAVYHDLGNLNYTFISSKREEGLDFAYFTAPIIEALASLGAHVSLSGRNDLLLGERKISGNAQHSREGRVLHHGTLLFDTDLTVLSSLLTVDEEKLRAKAIRSVSSRVTNLRPHLSYDMGMDEFISQLSSFVIQKFDPEIIDPPSCPAVDELYRRNASDEWIFPNRRLVSEYSIVRRKRYPFGNLEICLDMVGDRIIAASISGDFFEGKPVSLLEAELCGKSIYDGSVLTVAVHEYVIGMSSGQLWSLLKGE